MLWLYILLAVLLLLAAAAALIMIYCFRRAFYTRHRITDDTNDFALPAGEEYLPYHPMLLSWMKKTQALPYKAYSIRSFDGLRLCAKYYEFASGAPIEILFHGYRGTAKRDMSGAVQRCAALGHSAFIVDQRAIMKSEGHVITFGINESKDCLRWIDFIIETFGKDTVIFLSGISMGAATVLMAAGKELPENVIGVLADSGYTTAKEMIQKTIAEMGLPAKLAYPFVKCGARLFGRFDLEEDSPLEAVKRIKIPVIFTHCEGDRFVPCEMSRRMYAACNAPKILNIVPGGAHGMPYPVDEEKYIEAVKEYVALCHANRKK